MSLYSVTVYITVEAVNEGAAERRVEDVLSRLPRDIDFTVEDDTQRVDDRGAGDDDD